MTENQTTQGVTRLPRDVKELIRTPAFMREIEPLLPPQITPQRFVRTALNAVLRNPNLGVCSRQSLMRCLLDLAAIGLEPDGRRAHLVPFKRKDGVSECTLILDYKGLVELVMRNGGVKRIHAEIVHEKDIFEYNLGVVQRHQVNWFSDRGKPVGAWAMAVLENGETKCEVMTLAEIESVRARSRARDAGPWVTDWAEMAKKTVFRRLCKWLPLTPAAEDALATEDRAESESTAGLTVLAKDVEPAPKLAAPEEPEPSAATEPEPAPEKSLEPEPQEARAEAPNAETAPETAPATPRRRGRPPGTGTAKTAAPAAPSPLFAPAAIVASAATEAPAAAEAPNVPAAPAKKLAETAHATLAAQLERGMRGILDAQKASPELAFHWLAQVCDVEQGEDGFPVLSKVPEEVLRDSLESLDDFGRFVKAMS
jgi:recombination protein RecT